MNTDTPELDPNSYAKIIVAFSGGKDTQPIIDLERRWTLPLGAFGDSCGPS